MIKFFAVRATSLCALVAPVALGLSLSSAQTFDCDMTYDGARASGIAAQANDPLAKFFEYSGKDAAALMQSLNNEEPKSGMRADRLLVIEWVDINVVRVALVADGCVFHIGNINTIDWHKWLAKTFGIDD